MSGKSDRAADHDGEHYRRGAQKKNRSPAGQGTHCSFGKLKRLIDATCSVEAMLPVAHSLSQAVFVPFSTKSAVASHTPQQTIVDRAEPDRRMPVLLTRLFRRGGVAFHIRQDNPHAQ